MRAPRDQQTDQPRRWDRQKNPRSSVGDWACQCTKVHALWGRQKKPRVPRSPPAWRRPARRGDPWRAWQACSLAPHESTSGTGRTNLEIYDLRVLGSVHFNSRNSGQHGGCEKERAPETPRREADGMVLVRQGNSRSRLYA